MAFLEVWRKKVENRCSIANKENEVKTFSSEQLLSFEKCQIVLQSDAKT